MASETKLDESFSESQFLIKSFHLSFISGCNRNDVGVMLYQVRSM